MTSLASTAIYLASSLTAGPIPAPTPVAIVPTVMIVPVMDDIETRPVDSRVEANPFAAARARGGMSLSEAIADVVRRDALKDSLIDAGMGISLYPERQSQDDSLSEDITAAHDARIGFIRQRMDALRLDGASAGPLLEQLNAKLRLAVAARCLAVAREASEHLITLSDSPASRACLSAPRAMAINAAQVRSRPGYDRPRPSSANHQTAVDIAVASVNALLPHVTTAASGRPLGKSKLYIHGEAAHRVSTEAPASISALASAATIHPAWKITQPSENVPRASASDRARRLLASARHLLEDSHQQNSDIRLTGLLHWKGSETWSLTEYGHST